MLVTNSPVRSPSLAALMNARAKPHSAHDRTRRIPLAEVAGQSKSGIGYRLCGLFSWTPGRAPVGIRVLARKSLPRAAVASAVDWRGGEIHGDCNAA